jgi:hypothetical protein
MYKNLYQVDEMVKEEEEYESVNSDDSSSE